MNKVWLFACGEPLEIDHQDVRLHRAGKLADYLTKVKNIKVEFFSSTFNHAEKTNRFQKDKIIKLNNNLNLHLLYTLEYKKNISVKRLISNFLLGIKLAKYAKKINEKVDLIIVAYPPIETSLALLLYGIKKNVPVVIDVRDLWPEVFLTRYNRFLKMLLSIFLIPYHVMAKYIFFHATSLISISKNMLNWSQDYSARLKKKNDTYIHFSYKDTFELKIDENEKIFKLKKILDGKFNISLIGNISRTLEFENILKNADQLKKYNHIQFVICGIGDFLDDAKKLAKKHENIIFTNWLNQNEIRYVLKNSKIGLIPYKNDINLSSGIPNKFSEYLSFGVPVLTCLSGAIAEIIKKEKIGIYYDIGNEYDLTQKILQIYGDNQKHRDFIENARNLFLSKFEHEENHKKFFNHLKNIYDQLQ